MAHKKNGHGSIVLKHDLSPSTRHIYKANGVEQNDN